MNKFVILFFLLTVFSGGNAFASYCIVNETTKESVENPERDYKLWSLQKICFDNFEEPTKISTEDDKFGFDFYTVTYAKETSYGAGYKQLKILADHKMDPQKSITVVVIKSMERVPLSMTAKTSDDFQIVSSL